MKRNPWPAIVLILALLLVGSGSVAGFMYFYTKEEIQTEEVTALVEPDSVVEVDDNSDVVKSLEQPNVPLEFNVADLTISPSNKYVLGEFGVSQDYLMMYDNSNVVTYGTPTSWLCCLYASPIADTQIEHYADDPDEVLSKYKTTVSVFGTTTEACVYEYVDRIEIVASYANAMVVSVECYTTDIDVARNAFKEAMDVPVQRH